MLTSELVQPHHLSRQAVIYIRQSSPNQVLTHQESLRLQHALRQRAEQLGWSPTNIQVIDIRWRCVWSRRKASSARVRLHLARRRTASTKRSPPCKRSRIWAPLSEETWTYDILQSLAHRMHFSYPEGTILAPRQEAVLPFHWLDRGAPAQLALAR
jgi:hypothetical protein